MSGYDALMGKGPAATDEQIGQPHAAAPEVQPSETPTPAPTGEPVSATPPASEHVSPPAPVAQEAAPPAAERHDGYVPINVLLRTREELGGKVRQFEARAADLQRQLDDIKRREEEAVLPQPDPLLDPDAFRAHFEDVVQQRTDDLRREYESNLARLREQGSARHWSAQLGAEEWVQFNSWLGTLPADARKDLLRCDDPYGTAYPKFRKFRTFETLGGRTPQEWMDEQFEAIAAQRGYTLQAATPSTPAPVATPAPPQTQPRRSAPSLSEVVGVTTSKDAPVSGYDALFKR
jgi:hypothetical protein